MCENGMYPSQNRKYTLFHRWIIKLNQIEKILNAVAALSEIISVKTRLWWKNIQEQKDNGLASRQEENFKVCLKTIFLVWQLIKETKLSK